MSLLMNDPEAPVAGPAADDLVEQTGDLVNSARVPVTHLMEVFLWEVSNMIHFAVTDGTPEMRAKMRRLIGHFSRDCAELVGPRRVLPPELH
jgi:hypothetical protein